MRVALDAAACVGHGRCYALAPDVFDADDEGHCVILIPGELPATLEGEARAAIANCPEGALRAEG
jgi:ferredoxin